MLGLAEEIGATVRIWFPAVVAADGAPGDPPATNPIPTVDRRGCVGDGAVDDRGARPLVEDGDARTLVVRDLGVVDRHRSRSGGEIPTKTATALCGPGAAGVSVMWVTRA
jgi:hypothetical protein